MAYITKLTPILKVGPFPAIHKADLYPGDDTAYFKAPVIVEKGTKDFDALVAVLSGIADAVGASKNSKGKYTADTLGLKVIKDEDGEATSRYRYTPTSNSAPMLVDSTGTPMGKADVKGMVQIGEDSKIRIKIECDKGTKGQVRSYIKAIQVVDPVAPKAGSSSSSDDDVGFDKIDGGFVADRDFAPLSDDDVSLGMADGPDGDDGGLEI